MREIIQPTLAGMAAEGTPYAGFLYAGLMISPQGEPRVVEFNCRLGDPEAQPLLARLKTDLVDLIEAALAGSLLEVEAQWDRRPAVGVVLAAAGYPEAPRKGDVITGLPEECAPLEPQEPVLVFHAGTAEREGQIVTHGGRVLCVTALGETLREAIARAYAVADRIEFAGKQMRRDIGHRALNRHHP